MYPTLGYAKDERSKLSKKVARGLGVHVEQGGTHVVDRDGRVLFWYTVHRATAHRMVVQKGYRAPGRGRTTGRFNTREELIDRVEMYYNNTGMSQADIGKSCGVSQSVVNTLLNNEIADRSKHG